MFKQSLFCGFILKEAQKKKGGSKIVKDGSRNIYVAKCSRNLQVANQTSTNKTTQAKACGYRENATKTNCSVITNSFNSIPSLFKKEGGIRRRLFK